MVESYGDRIRRWVYATHLGGRVGEGVSPCEGRDDVYVGSGPGVSVVFCRNDTNVRTCVRGCVRAVTSGCRNLRHQGENSEVVEGR